MLLQVRQIEFLAEEKLLFFQGIASFFVKIKLPK